MKAYTQLSNLTSLETDSGSYGPVETLLTSDASTELVIFFEVHIFFLSF